MYTRVVLSFVLSFLALGGLMRGTPDGGLQPYGYASQETDPASIYNMLWGFSPINSQGRVYLLDTFNNGLGGFGYNLTGAAAVPSLFSQGIIAGVGNVIYVPPNAVKFSPGIVAGDFTSLNRQHYLGTNPKLGIEAGFTMQQTTPEWRFDLFYGMSTKAGAGYVCALLYDRALGQWKINLPGPSFVSIFNMPIPGASNILNMQVKISADWETGKYIKAFIGDNIIDLSSYSMQSAIVGMPGQITAHFQASSYGAGTGDGYLGYILLTKDEP